MDRVSGIWLGPFRNGVAKNLRKKDIFSFNFIVS